MSASDQSPRRSRRVVTAHKPGTPKHESIPRIRGKNLRGLPTISDAVALEIPEVKQKILAEPHCKSSQVAERYGVSQSSVLNIWRSHGRE